MFWWIEVKIKPWKQMFVYKMFPQVGDIQNNRKHLIDKFLVLLHLWSVYNGNDTQTMANYPMISLAHRHTCFSSKHPACQLPQLYPKVSTPAAFNSTLLSPPCIVGSTRLSFHGFVGPGRRGICGSVFWAAQHA